MSNTFVDMGLRKPLLDALSQLEITTPTPVQEKVITSVIQGGDWMVSSQTGSGKTFAFLLPVMHRMMDQSISPLDNLHGPETLVLCPTRELAQQVSQDAITLVRNFRGLRVATVVGGMPYGKQMAGLKGARLVVGTPGRLLDLADSGKLNLSNVTSLIIDEADRMLDLGFSDDLIAINKLCKARQQTLMFSATFAKHVMGLANSMMNEPTRIEMAPSNETNINIEQTLHWADNFGHKRKLLDHWLKMPELDQAVIFTSTQVDAEKLARDLGDNGYNACALHGAMPQVVRNRRLNSIRKGNIQILVATDVAARGLDVPTISHVINYGMPMKAEDYVHRIGRTGRAGRSGVAITLAQADEFSKVKAIEKFINASIPVGVVEGLEPQVIPSGRPAPGRGRRNGRGGGSGAPRHGGGKSAHRPREEFKGRGFEPSRSRSSDKPGFESSRGRSDRSSGFESSRGRSERSSGFESARPRADKVGFDERPRRSNFEPSRRRSEGSSFEDRPRRSDFDRRRPASPSGKSGFTRAAGAGKSFGGNSRADSDNSRGGFTRKRAR